MYDIYTLLGHNLALVGDLLSSLCFWRILSFLVALTFIRVLLIFFFLNYFEPLFMLEVPLQ